MRFTKVQAVVPGGEPDPLVSRAPLAAVSPRIASLSLLSLALAGCATFGGSPRTEVLDGATVTCAGPESGGAGRLHVAVVDEHDSPLSQAAVTVRRLTSDAVFTIVADDTGHLRIEHLLPGPYRVDVVVRSLRGRSVDSLPIRAGCTTSVTIRVGPHRGSLGAP